MPHLTPKCSVKVISVNICFPCRRKDEEETEAGREEVEEEAWREEQDGECEEVFDTNDNDTGDTS